GPRPSAKRPPELTWRSQARFAVTIGLRANATAIAVPSWSRSVARAAKASGMKGALAISGVVTPSKPRDSACRAAGATARQSPRGIVVSMRMRASGVGRPVYAAGDAAWLVAAVAAQRAATAGPVDRT